MSYTTSDWLAILAKLGVRAATAARWAGAFESEVQPDKFSGGEADIMSFLPQILHESGMLERTEENLNYSAERLMQVWPARFPTLSDALPYAHSPEALANRVYGGRMGNSQPGDGWTYRGRSPIQLTGRAAYAHVGDLMGQDLIGLPHLIEGPIYGLNAAVAWWEGTIPDSMLGDQVKLRRRVNGGTLGLAHVKELAAATERAFA